MGGHGSGRWGKKESRPARGPYHKDKKRKSHPGTIHSSVRLATPWRTLNKQRQDEISHLRREARTGDKMAAYILLKEHKMRQWTDAEIESYTAALKTNV